jgi:hypothetical protein
MTTELEYPAPALTLMEIFAEPPRNVVTLTGAYDRNAQRWCHASTTPSLRTNYPTWTQTQRTTNQHTGNGSDVVPDFPDDQQADQASD